MLPLLSKTGDVWPLIEVAGKKSCVLFDFPG
jgi:hypothetical protein